MFQKGFSEFSNTFFKALLACQVDQKADNCVTWKDNGSGGWVFKLSQPVKRGRQHFLQALFLDNFHMLSTKKNRH